MQNSHKKGFSLIELGIVIGVIVLLLVGIISSSSLISAAKVSSVMRKLNAIEGGVNQFQVAFKKEGINLGMGGFQKCLDAEKYFKNSTTNFCRAMYCDDVDAKNQFSSGVCDTKEQNYAFPQTYWANEMLYMAGYIGNSTSKIKMANAYLATHVGNALITKANISALDKDYSTSRLQSSSGLLGIGNSTAKYGWQSFLPSMDSSNFASVGFLRGDSLYYGTPYTILGNAYINNTEKFGPDANKYIITLGAKNTFEGALTSTESYVLDAKFDDGKPNSGKILAGRVEGTASECRNGGAFCFTGFGVKSSASGTGNGGMGASEAGACFNLGNDIDNLQPYTTVTDTATGYKTAQVNQLPDYFDNIKTAIYFEDEDDFKLTNPTFDGDTSGLLGKVAVYDFQSSGGYYYCYNESGNRAVNYSASGGTQYWCYNWQFCAGLQMSYYGGIYNTLLGQANAATTSAQLDPIITQMSTAKGIAYGASNNLKATGCESSPWIPGNMVYSTNARNDYPTLVVSGTPATLTAVIAKRDGFIASEAAAKAIADAAAALEAKTATEDPSTATITPITKSTNAPATAGEYTAVARKYYNKASPAGVAIPQDMLKRAKNDKTFGCNIVMVAESSFAD